MAYFPLPFFATVQRVSLTTDRSGQKTKHYTTIKAIVKCLYLETSGNKRLTGKEDFESVIVFYTLPLEDIQEQDRIINIRTKTGAIIEAGPFEVRSVKKVPGLTGKVHHTTIKLVGEAS